MKSHRRRPKRRRWSEDLQRPGILRSHQGITVNVKIFSTGIEVYDENCPLKGFIYRSGLGKGLHT